MNGQLTWNELISQPDAWARLLERLDARRDIPSIALDHVDEIVLVGSGTSYYLALAVADWISRRHAIAVRAVPSCEVMLDPEQVAPKGSRTRLVIAISRSGESSELILAVQALKGPNTTVLGVSCSSTSSLMKIADQSFLIDEGFEDGLIMLRSFTSMLLALQFEFGTPDDRAALRSLSAAGRELLVSQTDKVRHLAHRRSFDRFVFLASGASYPIALEASLKVQEMSISTSEAFHSLEIRHGPMAAVDADTFLTLLCPSSADLGLALANDMKKLGATLLVIGRDADSYDGIADLTIGTPASLNDGQANVLSLLPLQILAFETALRKGNNPDAPANLNKVVIL